MTLEDELVGAEFVTTKAGKYLIEVPTTGEISELGWSLPPDLSIEEWQEFGKRLGRSERSLGWWIGDWWVHGLDYYKASAKKIVAAPEWTGPSYRTCQKYAHCCKSIPIRRRRRMLTFWQHFELRNLPEKEQDHLLDGAVEYVEVHGKQPSVKQLRDQIKVNGLANNATKIISKEETHRADDTYPLAFCNPPWNKLNVLVEMDFDKQELPFADDAALFMVAGTNIADAGVLLTDWGFDNVGSLIWILPRKRPTVWTQEEHQVVLIGSRGDIQPQYVPPSTIEASSVTGILNVISEMFPYLSRKVQCLGEPIKGFDNWRPTT